MIDWIVAVLLVIGTLFSLIASIGILRMPDLYTRLQPGAKSGTLGAGCILAGAAIHFGDVGTVAQAVLVLLFLFLTAPVAAHMIGRAGYAAGIALSRHSTIDELRERYESQSDDGEPG